MRWPFWFPYPGAFAYALLLFFLLSIEASFIDRLLWFVGTVGGTATLIADLSIESFNVLTAWGVVSLVGLGVTVWVLALEYQLVRAVAQLIARKKPKLALIPSLKCWKDAVFGLSVLLIALVFLLSTSSLSHCYLVDCDEWRRSRWLVEAEAEMILFWVTALTVYAYHLRMLRRQWLERRRKRRNVKAHKTKLPKVKRPSKSPKSKQNKQPGAMAKQQLTVDEELEQLKRQVERDKKNKP